MKVQLAACILLATTLSASAGQAPGAADKPDIAVSARDRFYTSDQFSNTVSVIDPFCNPNWKVKPFPEHRCLVPTGKRPPADRAG